MTSEQEGILEDLIRHLAAAHAGREPLSHANLAAARVLLRLAEDGRMEVDEQQQARLDTLFGLFRWGQLIYPLTRVDPRVFAAERRDARGTSPGPQ